MRYLRRLKPPVEKVGLVITDKLLLGEWFNLVACLLISDIQARTIVLPETTDLLLYTEFDPCPTRYASWWIKADVSGTRYTDAALGKNVGLAEAIADDNVIRNRWMRYPQYEY